MTDGDCEVWGDHALLVTTAISNLVGNAIAYSDGAHPRRRERASRSAGDLVELAVTDQGLGIATDEQQRIFERFYRVDAARSRATGGTGLGLAIVKHVADNHGGEVSVWSEPGRGSTFTSLPAARSMVVGRQRDADSRQTATDRPSADPTGPHVWHARRARRPAHPGTRQPHGRTAVSRILVVEDEESFSDPLSYLLRSEGYEVAVAETGPDAPGRVRQERRRPRPARPHAARACPASTCAAQLRQRSSVPVIMLTAKDSEIDKVVGLEIGADDYVTKPYSSPRAARPHQGGAAPARRAGGPGPADPGVRPGPDGRRAPHRHGRAASATSLPLKEFELLEMLLRNAGRVLTRMQLIDRVWGSDYVGDTKTLDVHVKRLRAKIEPDPANPRAHRHRARARLQVRGG